MAADYDAPRKNDTDEDDTQSIEALKDRAPQAQAVSADLDDGDASAGFDLDAPDLVDATLDTVVVPIQDDEFTCVECFLIRPRHQHDHDNSLGPVCLECTLAA